MFGKLPRSPWHSHSNSACHGGNLSQDHGRATRRPRIGNAPNQAGNIQKVQFLDDAWLQAQRGTEKFAKKLLGENDIEAVLQRLDRLTMEESRMTATQTMEVVHGLFNNMKAVMEDGRTSTDNLQEALVKLQEIVEGVNKIKRDELQQAVRRWLSPPDPSISHNIACGSHHKGTATWFIGGAVYKEWKTQGSFAWLHGKPGSGKSVLCSSIIEDLEVVRMTGLALLAYYYFDFKDNDKQDLRGLLSSLLLQLAARSDAFYDILNRLYLARDKGLRQPSEGDLIECLMEVLAFPGQGKIYIVVDALDECPDNSGTPTPREKVLEFIDKILSLGLPHVRICVTSRPEVDIQASLEHLTSHCVSLHDEDGQSKDIIDYIKHFVDSDRKMGKWREEDKELVINTLAQKAQGMFRWVYCQLDTLRRSFPGSIRRALDELPRTLDQTYERILEGIDEEKWEYAFRLFQCLAVARRPLRSEELSEVLALELDVTGLPMLNVDLRPRDAEEAVLSACSTLITVIQPNPFDGTYDDVEGYHAHWNVRVIQFSHYSVKEFLTSSRLQSSSRQTLSRFYIYPGPAHTILAQSCISTLLQLDDFVNAYDFRGFPLAGYAAQNWIGHAQVEGVASQVRVGIEYLFDPQLPHFKVWVGFRRTYWPFSVQETAPWSPRGSAALYGFDDVVKYLITTHRQEVNADLDSITPLLAALKGGHLHTAQLLLQHGAAVDGRGRYSWKVTPLSFALRRGQLDFVQLFLDWGAQVNYQDRDNPDIVAPLHQASTHGYTNVVLLQLINSGADINAREGDGATSLHLASCNGNLDVVRLLVELGAEVNSSDDSGSTPLHEASSGGHVDVIQQLVNVGADSNIRNGRAVTPLHMASRNGKPNAVQILLERWGAP